MSEMRIQLQRVEEHTYRVWIAGMHQGAPRRLAWDMRFDEIVADCQRGSPTAIQLGHLERTLWEFLGPGWPPHAARLAARGGAVAITSDAREILQIPWEQLPLSDQVHDTIGGRGLLVRYSLESFEDSAAPVESRPEGGRALLAWHHPDGETSVARVDGGQRSAGNPWGEEFEALYVDAARRAPGCYARSGTDWYDVCRRAGLDDIVAALERARAAEDPIRWLHVACHGGFIADGDNFGLSLRDGVITAHDFANALTPFRDEVDVVLLTVCRAAGGGPLGASIYSPAIELHQRGFRFVIAWSRRIDGADVALPGTEFVLRATLAGGLDVASAVAKLRDAQNRSRKDGSHSLKLYARADVALRPFTFAPYRGLATFDQHDERFFCGREEEARQLAAIIASQRAAGQPRFLALSGASGTGKSSLVRAGLIPLLGAKWRVVVFSCDDADIANLEARVEELIATSTDKDAPVLFVLDQAEPLLHALDSAHDTTARRVLERLAKVAAEPDGPCSVLIALRSGHIDAVVGIFLHEPSGARTSLAVYLQRTEPGGGLVHMLELRPPSPEMLCEVIARPARQVGLSIAGAPETVVALANEIQGEAGCLPLLEFALQADWTRRVGTVMTLGANVAGRMSAVLDELRDRADPERQVELARTLTELVEVASDPSFDSLRARAEIDLHPPDAAAIAVHREVRDALVEKRVVVQSFGPDRTPTYQIGHYALIRAWPPLTRWVKQVRLRRVALAHAEAEARHWSADTRDPDRLKLRGRELAVAESAVSGTPVVGSNALRRYLRACRAAARRRLIWRTLVVLGLALVVGVAAHLVNRQSGEARRLALMDSVARFADEMKASARVIVAQREEAARKLDDAAQTLVTSVRDDSDGRALTLLQVRGALKLIVEVLESGAVATGSEPVLSKSVSEVLIELVELGSRNREVARFQLTGLADVAISHDRRFVAVSAKQYLGVIDLVAGTNSYTLFLADPIAFPRLDASLVVSSTTLVSSIDVEIETMLDGVEAIDLRTADTGIVVDDVNEVWWVDRGQWTLVPTTGQVLEARMSDDGKELLVLEADSGAPGGPHRLIATAFCACEALTRRWAWTARVSDWPYVGRDGHRTVQWSRDGRRLVVCSGDYVGTRAEVVDGREIFEIARHDEIVVASNTCRVCAGPDGVLTRDPEFGDVWFCWFGEAQADCDRMANNTAVAIDDDSCQWIPEGDGVRHLAGGSDVFVTASTSGLVELTDRREKVNPATWQEAVSTLCLWARTSEGGPVPDCERIESQIRPAAPDGDPAAIDDGDEAETDLDDEPEPTGSIWERARACEDIAGVWGARGACDGCGTKPPTLRIHVRADCRFGAEDVGSLKHQVGGVVDPASGGLHIAGGALDAHTYKLVLQGNGLTGTWLGGHDQRVRTMRGGKGWEPPRQRRTPLAALQRMAESQLEGTVQLPAIRTLREIRSYGTEAACDYLIGLSVTDLLRHRFWDNRHTILTEGVGCRGETLPKSP